MRTPRLLPLTLALCLVGCPIRVTPAPASTCPQKPNCGQCAAQASCAGWCPSAEPGLRGCYVTPDGCPEPLVSVVEACPDSPVSRHE